MSLTVSSSNPRYFQDSSGKPVYLTGSHNWDSLQDRGPNDFDYTGYVNWMEDNNYNFMRLWAGESQGSATSSIDPLPFARSDGSKGLAADGKPKFDLSKFDQDYFDRLRDRAIEAGHHGIYVSVMLFQGWSLDTKNQSTSIQDPWKYHPFNENNNINSVDGDPDNTGNGDIIETTDERSDVKSFQEAYVRKVIDTVGDLDNVLYEVSNEAPSNSEQWQYKMIDYIKDYQAGKGQDHPVGMTVEWPNGSNSDLFNSPADWVSPNRDSGYLDNPPVNNSSKVVITDTDHIWGGGGDATWVWKSFTRGLNTIFMDD